MPEGRYQLLFEFVGSFVRGGIDDVKVSLGECPQHNCTETDYMCTSDYTCIPVNHKCDSVPNCGSAEDELCGMAECMVDLRENMISLQISTIVKQL